MLSQIFGIVTKSDMLHVSDLALQILLALLVYAALNAYGRVSIASTISLERVQRHKFEDYRVISVMLVYGAGHRAGASRLRLKVRNVWQNRKGGVAKHKANTVFLCLRPNEVF